MPRGGPRLRGEGGELNMVGGRVRQRREELEMFRDQFAAQLAVATDGKWNPSVDEIYNLEARIRIVSDYEMVTLAAVLDCEVMWLLGFTDKTGPFSV